MVVWHIVSSRKKTKTWYICVLDGWRLVWKSASLTKISLIFKLKNRFLSKYISSWFIYHTFHCKTIISILPKEMFWFYVTHKRMLLQFNESNCVFCNSVPLIHIMLLVTLQVCAYISMFVCMCVSVFLKNNTAEMT